MIPWQIIPFSGFSLNIEILINGNIFLENVRINWIIHHFKGFLPSDDYDDEYIKNELNVI